MTIAQEVFEIGRQIAGADDTTLRQVFHSAINRFVGTPFKLDVSQIVDKDGSKTDSPCTVIYKNGPESRIDNLVRNDTVAAVVELVEDLSIVSLQSACQRIRRAKQLKKAPVPNGAEPQLNTVYGALLAATSKIQLEDLAEEFKKLTVLYPSQEWPDMIAIASSGAIHFTIQFPGESLCGDFLLPSQQALSEHKPPMYVIMVLRPTGLYTFNKMLASLFAHLALSFKGAKVPRFPDLLDGVPSHAITQTGYQYDLKGNLRPVPRQFYNDRYFPPPPLRIETRQGDLLSTIQFLPWQDGGVILLNGKLSLELFLAFLQRPALNRARNIVRPSDRTISFVLPISQGDFGEMLMRFQQRSNMVVRREEGNWVLQKFSDEGSTSPFMARLFMGVMRLRDVVYHDRNRLEFDRHYELVISPLMDTRGKAAELTDLWNKHLEGIKSGKTARRQGRAIHIEENIDKPLRMVTESFINTGSRAIKQGLQGLAKELQTDIGFLFGTEATFDAGVAALNAKDPILAKYLQQVRIWSEKLINVRNDIEHSGWVLPRVTYGEVSNEIVATEPTVCGQRVTEFSAFIADRLSCFIEEFIAHALQLLMPPELTISEISPTSRAADVPERFTVTPAIGGAGKWSLAYRDARFDEI